MRDPKDLLEQILNCWRVNNRVNLLLLRGIPEKGFLAVPLASRGRNVAQQFAHLHKARYAWLKFNAPDLLKNVPRFGRAAAPSRAQLIAAFRATEKPVEALLHRTLAEGGKIKMFKKRPVRWIVYMMVHDAHHRGQIALALKQNGMRLSEKIAIHALWGTWVWGKP
jgi:uncharacterized damage-inducible protein DinB